VSDTFDPYKTLQVDPEADLDVIQAAYRRLAYRFHPDRADGEDASRRMVALNRAWELLSDPGRRAEIDAQRAARPAGPTETPGAPESADPRTERSARASARPHDEPIVATFTTGRSAVGGGYDERTMRSPDGMAAAGPPPGHPSGAVLTFGRYAGWSLGEIARRDLEYLEWLDRTPIGRPHRDAIDTLLRAAGKRRSPEAEARSRRGLFRRP
jgi:curved DNA-binding protein CbpA